MWATFDIGSTATAASTLTARRKIKLDCDALPLKYKKSDWVGEVRLG